MILEPHLQHSAMAKKKRQCVHRCIDVMGKIRVWQCRVRSSVYRVREKYIDARTGASARAVLPALALS